MPAYDPRLDLGEVPAEGLIAAVGWDGMLDVLKERERSKKVSNPAMLETLERAPSAW